MMRATDIVGYTYRADDYCGGCITEAMIQRRDASPAARDEGWWKRYGRT